MGLGGAALVRGPAGSAIPTIPHLLFTVGQKRMMDLLRREGRLVAWVGLPSFVREDLPQIVEIEHLDPGIRWQPEDYIRYS
jgi:hypothetical protein